MSQVARLEKVLAETEAKLDIKNVAFATERVVIEPSDIGLEREERISKLQTLLNKAAAEAEESAKALREMEVELSDRETQHDKQVGTLREQFGKYRDAQERLVNGLNSQIRSLKETRGNWTGGGAGFGGRGGRRPFSRVSARVKSREKEISSPTNTRDAEELLTQLAEVRRIAKRQAKKEARL